MKLTFIGSGSAFTVGYHNYHSNMLLENDSQQNLLIDCGSDARLALNELGLTYKNINHVYISHLHADHTGGLEWLAFTHKFDPSCNKPTLYTSENLIYDLWNKALAGGLSSIQGKEANLPTFFNVEVIKESESAFIWEGLKIQIIRTLHAVSNNTMVPSYGLLFRANDLTVFITTDTRFSYDHLNPFYHKADIIFHDCETKPEKSGIHATYEELKTLDQSSKEKMWLYHYNPGQLPDAKKDGFRGFVKKGQIFDFKNPKTLF